MTPGALRVAVLASGAGTNLGAILDRVHGREGIEVVAVAASAAGIGALRRADVAGVETGVFPLADRPGGREERDAALADWLSERGVDLVVLAGWMQLLTPGFLARFSGRVVNVHPSLLPAFPGLRAVEQAVAYGVRVFGVTVHLVDEGVDTGPIILQRAIELPDADDPEQVRERLHALEHELLPEAIRLVARGALAPDPAAPRRLRIAP